MHLNKKISVFTILLFMTLFSSSVFAWSFFQEELRESIIVTNNSSQEIAINSPADLTIEPGKEIKRNYKSIRYSSAKKEEQRDLTLIKIFSAMGNTPICTINATLIYSRSIGWLDYILGRGFTPDIQTNNPRCRAKFKLYSIIVNDLDLVIIVGP